MAREILHKDEGNVAASWLILSENLGDSNRQRDSRLQVLARNFAEYQPQINELIKMSENNNDFAMAHYLRAVSADAYNNMGRAISELDATLAIQSNNVRYLFKKLRFQLKKSRLLSDTLLAQQAVATSLMLVDLMVAEPSIYADPSKVYFELALHYPKVEGYADIIDTYYPLSIQTNTSSLFNLSYAWNNLSSFLVKTRRCYQALESADGALNIMSYDNAVGNRQKALACIDLLEKGLISQPERELLPILSEG